MFFMMELSDLRSLTHIIRMILTALHPTILYIILDQFLVCYRHVFFGRPTILGIAKSGFGQLAS